MSVTKEGAVEIEGKGLVSQHAYTIKDLIKNAVKGENLIRLRNPWGHKEWTGKWSDNDKSWTSALRK